MENLLKGSETKHVSLNKKIQKTEEKISGVDDIKEENSMLVKENSKSKMFLIVNIQKFMDTMEISNLKGIEGDFQF